jgi:hypothetical protein
MAPVSRTFVELIAKAVVVGGSFRFSWVTAARRLGVTLTWFGSNGKIGSDGGEGTEARDQIMNAQITVTLPEEVFQRAERWAQRAGRPLADFLAETIALSLKPLGTPTSQETPLTDWSDDEVLAGADAVMPPAQDRRLSELLTRQQAGLLTPGEQTELTALMQIYQEGLLRKARALREGVRRGLRGPLQP